ncbi:MAG: hypothetical protein JJV98_07550 [Desulfosarcina sp.]|nr:hypothetical protein [Desulfobacterales bacterium]
MRKLIFVISTMVLLMACGPRWMYTNLDWLIPWYVEDYIALNTQQNDQLAGPRLAYQLEWHCRTQMSRYADFLRQLRDDLSIPGQPVAAARWADHLDQLKQYGIDLVHQVGPDAVAILATATDVQVDTLFENLEKTNLDLQREYVDPPPAARRRNRQKRMQKRIAYWTGPLTKTQKGLMAEWAGRLEETAEAWLAHRRRFQEALHHRLNQRHQDQDFQRRFIDLLARPDKLRDPPYQEKIDINKRLTFHFLEKLSESLTLKQRRHIVDRFEKLAVEMEQLACEPAQIEQETDL